MDEKISLEAIAAYGDAYADKISKRFFSSKRTISGSEILSLCDVPQVNMFVIRELLVAWREETQKVRSPYFDYANEEVKEALTHFMAVLSNHISVDEEHLMPLLKKAVRQTLLLIFNPYDFFSILVTGTENKIELNRFREEIKYLKINKEPLAQLVQKLEEKGVGEISGNEAFAMLDQILEEVNFTPEDFDAYIGQFSRTLPLDPASFFPVKEVPQPPASPTETAAPPKPPLAGPAGLNHHAEVKPTLNDRIHSEHRPRVYENFKKIARIKDHLTINQKFMFTKVLFSGDFESFTRAVDALDELSDMDEALQYLEAQSSQWDRESKEFHEFMEMVEKRFS